MYFDEWAKLSSMKSEKAKGHILPPLNKTTIMGLIVELLVNKVETLDPETLALGAENHQFPSRKLCVRRRNNTVIMKRFAFKMLLRLSFEKEYEKRHTAGTRPDDQRAQLQQLLRFNKKTATFL